MWYNKRPYWNEESNLKRYCSKIPKKNMGLKIITSSIFVIFSIVKTYNINVLKYKYNKGTIELAF